MNRAALFLPAICLVSVAANVFAEDDSNAKECGPTKFIAPGIFNNPSESWGGTDTGIVVDNFVELSEKDGLLTLWHGVDLSSYNDVNYKILDDCTTSFALVKLDSAFEKHSQELQNYRIKVIPYFFFPISKELRQRNNYDHADENRLKELRKQFDDSGTDSAKEFLTRSSSLLNDELKSKDKSLVPGVWAGVDVEQKLINEKASTESERISYGRLYAVAICSWVTEVKKAFPEIRVFLYTSPSVYGDYISRALPQDNACLNGLPVWLARTTPHGGDIDEATGGQIKVYVQRLCEVSAGNRCVIHQYTHRGIFGATGDYTKEPPPHLDLDRFFPVKMVQDSFGGQYVRK